MTACDSPVLEAIALAAKTPGPIDIVAFSGGAQTFTTAYNMLTPDMQNRIGSITYIDPAGKNLTAGNESVTVMADTAGLVNYGLSLIQNYPYGSTPVTTGNCGHDLDCVLNKFGGDIPSTGDACTVRAGGYFGGDYREVLPLGEMLSYYEREPVPSVTNNIRYDLPE